LPGSSTLSRRTDATQSRPYLLHPLSTGPRVNESTSVCLSGSPPCPLVPLLSLAQPLALINPMRSLLALFLASVAVLAVEPNRALVFSKTAGFRHKESIIVGNKLLGEQFKAAGLEVDFSEDAASFSAESLKKYRAVAFMSVTGDVMGDAVALIASKEAKEASAKAAAERRAAFQAWMENGGAYVGIHAASDAGAADKYWPWYAKMVGGLFNGHPAQQVAVLHPIVKNHPAVAHLSADWKRKDEWYGFKNLDPENIVLLEIDEKSYSPVKGKENGEHHPMAWCKDVGKGRMFYTALGHTKESYSEPEFIQHLNGGLLWTLRK
jgi:type 1 glutamine amidotransferase